MEDAFYWWIYTRPYLVWSSAREDLFFPFEFIAVKFTPISRRFIKKVKPIQQTPSSTSQALKSDNFKTVQTMTSKPREFYQNLSWWKSPLMLPWQPRFNMCKFQKKM